MPFRSTASKSGSSRSAVPVSGAPFDSVRPTVSSPCRTIQFLPGVEFHADPAQHQRRTAGQPRRRPLVPDPVLEFDTACGGADGAVDLAHEVAHGRPLGPGADGVPEAALHPAHRHLRAHRPGERAHRMRDRDGVVRAHLEQQIAAIPAILRRKRARSIPNAGNGRSHSGRSSAASTDPNTPGPNTPGTESDGDGQAGRVRREFGFGVAEPSNTVRLRASRAHTFRTPTRSRRSVLAAGPSPRTSRMPAVRSRYRPGGCRGSRRCSISRRGWWWHGRSRRHPARPHRARRHHPRVWPPGQLSHRDSRLRECSARTSPGHRRSRGPAR